MKIMIIQVICKIDSIRYVEIQRDLEIYLIGDKPKECRTPWVEQLQIMDDNIETSIAL
jgi:hypothetical protein